MMATTLKLPTFAVTTEIKEDQIESFSKEQCLVLRDQIRKELERQNQNSTAALLRFMSRADRRLDEMHYVRELEMDEAHDG